MEMNMLKANTASILTAVEQAVKGNIVIFSFSPEEHSYKEIFGTLFDNMNEKYGNFKIIYITSNRPCQNVKALFPKIAPKLFFIDCVCNMSGGVSETTESGIYVNSPNALTEVGIAVEESLKKFKKDKVIGILDSISTFLVYNERDMVIKFVNYLIVKFREENRGAILFVTKSDVEKMGVLTQNSDTTITY